MKPSPVIDDEIRRSITAPHTICVTFPYHIVNFSYGLLFASLIGRGGAGVLAAVNAGMPESKSAIMASISPAFHEQLPAWAHDPMPVERVDHAGAVLDLLAKQGMGLPVVAKPELGLQGLLVQKLDSPLQLERYLTFLARKAPGHGIHLQAVVEDPVEFTAFYVREPRQPAGRVIHLVLRQAPCVVGDGCSTLGELIMACRRPMVVRRNLALHETARCASIPAAGEVVTLGFARNGGLGGMYKEITGQLSDAFSQRIDAIARSMGFLQYGRFDLRCPSLHEAMQENRFTIMEVNGALSVNGVIYAENVCWLRALLSNLSLMHRLRKVALQAARSGAPVMKTRAYWRQLRSIIDWSLALEKIDSASSATTTAPGEK